MRAVLLVSTVTLGGCLLAPPSPERAGVDAPGVECTAVATAGPAVSVSTSTGADDVYRLGFTGDATPRLLHYHGAIAATACATDTLPLDESGPSLNALVAVQVGNVPHVMAVTSDDAARTVTVHDFVVGVAMAVASGRVSANNFRFMPAMSNEGPVSTPAYIGVASQAEQLWFGGATALAFVAYSGAVSLSGRAALAASFPDPIYNVIDTGAATSDAMLVASARTYLATIDTGTLMAEDIATGFHEPCAGGPGEGPCISRLARTTSHSAVAAFSMARADGAGSPRVELERADGTVMQFALPAATGISGLSFVVDADLTDDTLVVLWHNDDTPAFRLVAYANLLDGPNVQNNVTIAGIPTASRVLLVHAGAATNALVLTDRPTAEPEQCFSLDHDLAACGS